MVTRKISIFFIVLFFLILAIFLNIVVKYLDFFSKI